MKIHPLSLSSTAYLWLCLLVKGTCLNAAVSHHAPSSFRRSLYREAFLEFSCHFYGAPWCHVYAFGLQSSLLCLSSLLDSELLHASDSALFLPMAWQSSRGLCMGRERRQLPRATVQMKIWFQQGLFTQPSTLRLVIYSTGWLNEDLGGVEYGWKEKERKARGLRYCFIFLVRI